MHPAAYRVDVASARRRRENVPRHILCSIAKLMGCQAFVRNCRWQVL